MLSSYKVNNYAEVFHAIINAFKPINAVELGVLHGYSTRAIVDAIKANGRGFLNAYDLFEDYPFNHSIYDQVIDIFVHDLEWVQLHKQDAFTVHQLYGPNSVDFLHVDISNDGEVLRRIMEQWDPKMIQGGVMCIEGGSQEREEVEWMSKYNKVPLKYEFENNPIIKEKYIFGTYLKYPSVTMLLKKR